MPAFRRSACCALLLAAAALLCGTAMASRGRGEDGDYKWRRRDGDRSERKKGRHGDRHAGGVRCV